MTVLITLTTAGANTGPFNLYSDIDGYTAPFESSVAKSALLAGYTSTVVPNGTTIIKVLSAGDCITPLYISLYPTTTTTTTTCFRPEGLPTFGFGYATTDPIFDFTSSLTDACNSLGTTYYGLSGQAVDLTVGQTVYYGLSTSCELVPTGYYILTGGTTVIYIVDGIVDSYPSCPTTTTTTTTVI